MAGKKVERGPSVLTPSELSRYESRMKRKALVRFLTVRNMCILLIFVLLAIIAVMDMANFLNIGIL